MLLSEKKLDYWKTIMPNYSKGTPGCIVPNENLNILKNINLDNNRNNLGNNSNSKSQNTIRE